MPSAVPEIGRAGTVALPHATAAVELPITADRFTAAASGQILFGIAVARAEGSGLTIERPRLADEAGRPVPVPWKRDGSSWIAYVSLRPGDYTVDVRGQGVSTGPFVVVANVVGDVNGDDHVDQSDLDAIAAARGSRVGDASYSPALDLNGNGVVDAWDLRLAGRNLGTAANQVTFVVQNSTPKLNSDFVYVSIYAEDPKFADPSLNPDGWVSIDANGKITPLVGETTVSSFALSTAPAGISVPNSEHLISGEIYIGLGVPVVLKVNTTTDGEVLGVAAPNPSNATDPNKGIAWEFAEFTLVPGTTPVINTDISEVDAFTYPITLQTTPADPSSPNGVGVTPDQSDVIAGFKAYVGADSPFLDDVVPINANIDRLVSPKNVVLLDPQGSLATYYDAYINQVFDYYAEPGHSVTLSVTNPDPKAADPGLAEYEFDGNVITVADKETGETFTLFKFVGQDGIQKGIVYYVYSPFTPYPFMSNPPTPTEMVFANSGVFDDSSIRPTPPIPAGSNLKAAIWEPIAQKVLGNIENQLVSAMSRGIALNPYSTWLDPTTYYPKGGTANYYAGFFHQPGDGQQSTSIDQKAYGFPYDDQGDQSTDMSTENPTQVTITLGWSNPLTG